MNVRLGWGAVVVVALAAGLGATALVAQDKGGDAAKPSARKELRAGDEVEVVVTCRAKVAADGSIRVPGFGNVDAAGRTIDELRAAITKQAAAPGVTCAVRLAAPGAVPVVGASPAPTGRNVFFIGAVRGTVQLPADRNLRIIEVMAKAGASESSDADLSHVRVRRVGVDGQPFTFDVNVDDIVDRNQEQQNIVVFENDIVIVPKRK